MLEIIGLDDRYQLIREDGTQAIIPLNVSYIHQIDSEYASLILIDYTEIQGMATETFKYDAIEIDGQTFSDLDSAIASLGNVIAGGSSADALEMEVVTELPTVGSTKIIYLLQTEDNYEEWVYQNSEWIMIGQMNAQTYQGKDAIKVEKINTGDSATTIHWIVKNTDKFLTQDDSGATAIVDLKYEKESGGTDESGQTIYNHFLRLYGKDSGTPVTEIDINDLYKDNYLVSATYDDAKQALVLTFKIDNHYQNVEVPIPTAYKGKEAIKIEKAAGDSAFTVSLVVDNTSVSGLTQSNSGIKLVADDAINSASTNVVQNKKVYEALDAIHIVSGTTTSSTTYTLNVMGVDKDVKVEVANDQYVSAITVDNANQQIILDKVNADGTVAQLSGNAENIIFENDVKDGLKVDNHELKVKLKDGEKVLTVDSGGVESHLSLSAETSIASGVVTNTTHLKGIEGTEIASATTKLKQGDNISLSLSADTIEISGKNYTIIESLTGTGKADVLYLYKQTDATTSAVTYTQYAYVDNAWVQVSSAEAIDINNYYTKTEVNTALASKADTSAVTAVNSSLTAHTADTDIHVTSADKTAWNAKSDFSGSYNDLTDKPTIPTVPTSNTAFTNDAGYITSGEAATQIEAATSGKADTSAVTEAISSAVSGKVDTTAFNTYSAATDARLAEDEEVTAAGLNALNDALGDKADTSAVTEAISSAVSGKADTTAVTESINEAVSGKQDTLVSGVNIKTINNESLLGEGNITIQGGGGVSSGEVETMIAESISGKVDTTAYTAYSAATDSRLAEDEEVTAAGLNALNDALGDKADTSAVTASIAAAVSGKQDTLIAGSGITISGNVISSEGGNKVVELTQAQYNALVDKDPDTFYIITDAEAIDINNYYTKTAVDTALAAKANTATTYNKTEVDTALSNKVDTSAITTSITSASTNTQVSSAKAVYDQLGGLKLVKITQAAYDQLATKDPNTLYVIVD